MMYWFGELKSDSELFHPPLWEDLTRKRVELYQTPIEKILELLDRFSNESFNEALPELIQEAGFTEEETRKTLSMLHGLLKRENLEERLKAEFTNPQVLDSFSKLPGGAFKTRAVPAGVLLHVTAGNVFLSSIDSLIMGFLTKNLSIVKVSSQNTFFPQFFARKLKSFDSENILSDKFSIIHFKGGDSHTEDFLKNKVNTIIAWGGEEMISSYQNKLPRHVKLLDFGPKISLQVVSKKGLVNKSLTEVAGKIVQDIVPWDQGACASPQNLYLEEGIPRDELMLEIEKAFHTSPKRGPIDTDEATEILKEKYRAFYSELMEGGRLVSGEEYLLHAEEQKAPRPSPLHRSLVIKNFSSADELLQLLTPLSYYLQSCSYLLSRDEEELYLNTLALTGLKRFAPLGTITFGMNGAPHDGRFVLRELVTFVGNEIRATHFNEKLPELSGAIDLKRYFDESVHPAGYIFSSGGTTGEPKYVHFSYEEFDFMSDMLAQNYRAQGIRSGMTVANLFVAGNLWSSFLCVEKALEKIGAIQLPIGGMCSQENILMYLKKFKPDVVMGIPSMLVSYAEYGLSQNESLEVPMVFYAGESLSKTRQEFLQNTWKSRKFGSAGYASVDAGVIGFQCSHCAPGEHHVFADLIDLKIIEDEGVVTSLARNTMPVVNYRTGDKMEWISPCECGLPEPRFKLLGRIDDVIQVWSCRLLINDLVKPLEDRGVLTLQLKLLEAREANLVKEKLIIFYEEASLSLDEEAVLLEMYERSRDMKDTIDLEDFRENTEIKKVSPGSIERNPRTGKIKLVLDQRN